MSSELTRITTWFEALTTSTLVEIDRIYAGDASFKDPFNDVRGIDHIRAIYAHMFENLTDPRFVITHTIEQMKPAHEAFVSWQFRFGWRARAFDIPGGTRFVINTDGLVSDHVDYWDVAQLYERLPLLGSVLRPLRRRMAAV